MKRSKLVRMSIRNIGCIGNDSVDVELDNIVCLVGRNNAGKSTVLRAYEMASGSRAFDPMIDRHQRAAEADVSEVILDVHIPDGIANVSANWKVADGDLLIVRSRWQWAPPKYEMVRQTWNPAGGDDGKGAWATDAKASGADNVFNSKLPKPLRIGSLDDSRKTEADLITLALAPLIMDVELQQKQDDSYLANTLREVSNHLGEIGNAHAERFHEIARRVSRNFKGVFPGMDLRLNVAPSPLIPKLSDLLKSGSGIRVLDGADDTSVSQQGTGARRALFWAMLEVHNELVSVEKGRAEHRKALVALIKKAKQGTEEADRLGAQLAAHDAGGPIPSDDNDPALPGYILLIDEPENALHPMAARAAQRHLYALAENPQWQVMLTTHSPYFINPLEDHTTVIRMERAGQGQAVTVRTYRSDSITFEGDGKQRLKALQHLDPSFAEIFFGSYPILVEGDTEHAAFLASIIEEAHPLQHDVTIVRARGKAILVHLIALLRHFKVDFGVLHDADSPFNSDARRNGMWTENAKIQAAVVSAREQGVVVRHRVSIPNFEDQYGLPAGNGDKPLVAYDVVRSNESTRQVMQQLVADLHGGVERDGWSDATESFMSHLAASVGTWAEKFGFKDDVRFAGSSEQDEIARG